VKVTLLERSFCFKAHFAWIAFFKPAKGFYSGHEKRPAVSRRSICWKQLFFSARCILNQISCYYLEFASINLLR